MPNICKTQTHRPHLTRGADSGRLYLSHLHQQTPPLHQRTKKSGIACSRRFHLCWPRDGALLLLPSGHLNGVKWSRAENNDISNGRDFVLKHKAYGRGSGRTLPVFGPMCSFCESCSFFVILTPPNLLPSPNLPALSICGWYICLGDVLLMPQRCKLHPENLICLDVVEVPCLTQFALGKPSDQLPQIALAACPPEDRSQGKALGMCHTASRP